MNYNPLLPTDFYKTTHEHLPSYTIGEGVYNEERIRSFYRLGYLPIAMYAVPEGVETANWCAASCICKYSF